MVTTLFFVLLFIAVYPYIIYPLIGIVIVCLKRILTSNKKHFSSELPHISLLIAAYNEELFIEQKIKNTQELDYPAEKLSVIIVTDGSTDKTPEIVAKHTGFIHLHQPERNGKIHAMQRGITHVTSEIIVFCDANTFLNKDALKHIAHTFQNPTVGCVSGEKRVMSDAKDSAAPAGEGFYWKYESWLKKLDSKIYTVVGAAGELFAIRRSLYEEIPNDTILDDFLITLKIARKGYRINYEPLAVASEYGSVNVEEEMKRKIRISAGCFQVVYRNFWLLNIFKHPVLAFQFISHKFMRWLITPILMTILLPLNIIIALLYPTNSLILVMLALQIMFYIMALTGYFAQHKTIKHKFLFFPYYFIMANLAQFMGLARFVKGNTSVKWERAERVTKK
jgi:biofilm PGA synthesis N-glycosyltransferase PgaC